MLHSAPSRLQWYSFTVGIDLKYHTVRYMQYLEQTNRKGKQQTKKSQGLALARGNFIICYSITATSPLE